MADSTELYHRTSDGQQKFDYFVTALTGALLSYLSQAYTPHRLTFGPEALDPFALVMLSLSFLFGFKRIETVIRVMEQNHRMLDAAEKAGQATQALAEGIARGVNVLGGETFTAQSILGDREAWMAEKADARKGLERWGRLAGRYYDWRNRFLYAGLGAIVLSKLLLPYFPRR